VAQEMSQHFQVGEAFEEHLLVIASQAAHRAAALPCPRYCDHSGAFGAPIDKVAQEHDRAIRGIRSGIVGIDGGNQGIEQIAAPVDVTDYIPALSLWNGRWGQGGRRSAKELAERSEHGR
jgi:hypothetical protein